jgi:hypothetical protein
VSLRGDEHAPWNGDFHLSVEELEELLKSFDVSITANPPKKLQRSNSHP